MKIERVNKYWDSKENPKYLLDCYHGLLVDNLKKETVMISITLKQYDAAKKMKNVPNGIFFSIGWNNSYHDSNYHPMLVATDRNLPRACSRLRKFFKKIKNSESKIDSSVERFKARQLVRTGD